MNSLELLQETTKIINKSVRKHKEKGDYFNIFYILNKERDEAHSHCLFIYELLNPNGRHFLGDIFLRLFFDIVLKKPYQYENISVFREFAFDEHNRLDFLIKSKDFCYPIEVKIDASEGDNQIERYCNWAKSISDNAAVYFLTLYGKEACTVSETNKSMVKTISFKNHISKWLIACMDYVKDNPALYECIRQYYNVIERLTTDMNEQEKAETKNLISSSSENMKSAFLIQKTFEKAKAEMDIKVFSAIEEYMDKKIGNRYEKIDRNYIERAGKTFPALSYCLYKQEDTDCALALRFEIETNLFFGIAFYKKDKENKWVQSSRDNTCFKDIPVPEKYRDCFGRENKTSWFESWKYLPSDDKTIGFRNHSDAWFNLFNDEFFEQTMQEVFSNIDIALKKLDI